MNTELTTIDGHPVLTLRRTLAHPPQKVWRALTDPTELSTWFPATVEFDDTTPGTPMRFTQQPGTPADHGEILEADPPRVFAFRWNTHVIRCEILPHDTGCQLVFTHTLRGPDADQRAAARTAAGWDICLNNLHAQLDDQPAPEANWLANAEHYLRAWGLADGAITPTDTGWTLRFERDLVHPPATVWNHLTGETTPEPGTPPPPPATHGYGDPATVTESTPPHTLEYRWGSGGHVRFTLRDQHPIGTRLVLTHTVPHANADERATLLAAWHTHLELLFAALFGDIRRPWPGERTAELTEHYTARLRETDLIG